MDNSNGGKETNIKLKNIYILRFMYTYNETNGIFNKIIIALHTI